MTEATDQLAEIATELREVRSMLESMGWLVDAERDRQRRLAERRREFEQIMGYQQRPLLRLVRGEDR